MGIPFRNTPPKDSPESDAQSSAEKQEPLYKRAFKGATRRFVYAQMYYKVAQTHEKVILQLGMQAAIFIPGSSFAGLYLLYGDAKDYIENKKNGSDEPIVAKLPCQQDFKGVAMLPIKCCKHQQSAPEIDEPQLDPKYISPIVPTPKN